MGQCALAAANGHDVNVVANEQENDCWDFWERNVEFYDLIVVHCKTNPDVDVDAHDKDRAAERESDDEG